MERKGEKGRMEWKGGDEVRGGEGWEGMERGRGGKGGMGDEWKGII